MFYVFVRPVLLETDTLLSTNNKRCFVFIHFDKIQIVYDNIFNKVQFIMLSSYILLLVLDMHFQNLIIFTFQLSTHFNILNFKIF